MDAIMERRKAIAGALVPLLLALAVKLGLALTPFEATLIAAALTGIAVHQVPNQEAKAPRKPRARKATSKATSKATGKAADKGYGGIALFAVVVLGVLVAIIIIKLLGGGF